MPPQHTRSRKRVCIKIMHHSCLYHLASRPLRTKAHDLTLRSPDHGTITPLRLPFFLLPRRRLYPHHGFKALVNKSEREFYGEGSDESERESETKSERASSYSKATSPIATPSLATYIHLYIYIYSYVELLILRSQLVVTLAS